jgi:hypothetical protein
MGYPQDLLEAAHSFLLVEPPTQATLRRTVSTAYYALFHLLIEDACRLWREPDHRGRLSRQCDHKRMREASASRASACETGTDLWVVSHTFVFLQQQRHAADYDLALIVSPLDVAVYLGTAQLAFRSWSRIREDSPARDYLFSLLFRDRV